MRIPFPGASLRSLAGWCGRPSSSCSSTTSSSATSSQHFRWDFGISSEWWGGGWSVAEGTRIDGDFFFPDLGIGGTVTMFSSHSPTGRKTYQRFILFYCTQVRPLEVLSTIHCRIYWSLYPWLTYSHLIVVSSYVKLFIGPTRVRSFPGLVTHWLMFLRLK